MILIADSGSTKTDWRLIDAEKRIHQCGTQGINPYFQTKEEVTSIFEREIPENIKSIIKDQKVEINFYGAGCSAEDKKQLVKEALSAAFPLADIFIESDMLGAARSVCGHEPGIAAILGTGMNSCYYDGKKIAENRTSLGFILGDEGSGAHLGKTLIQYYLNDELPGGLTERFNERFKLSKNEIIDSVYKKPMPNRYLASYSKFIYQNLKEQFIIDMVSKCFREFFDKHICKYSKHKELKLSLVGSVAFYYSNILRSVAEDKGVNIDVVVETPIAGLTLYHLEE
ncbi:MAG: N-acetylglucosamine kinase [Bacteroidetes bacterium]|jgi:N-acetylglucosamine kinase-like BadF-type ATPase|nr:N-acetylglucosamine kinase [Bacteroidota bacterium]